MRTRISILFTLFTLCLVPSAWAQMGSRQCVGPITMNAAYLYGPGPSGMDVSGFDGDISVHVWKRAAINIAVEVQSTLFSAAEDPTNDAWKTNDTMTSTDQITLKGPLRRLRYFLSTCDSGCLADVMVCGRVSK